MNQLKMLWKRTGIEFVLLYYRLITNGLDFVERTPGPKLLPFEN
jgi:hypothetical protein